MRTQPLDFRWPTVHGLLVPCMPYRPHGTFKPIQRVPNPPAQAALSVILKCPTGVGVLGSPMPTLNLAMGRPFSSTVSVRSDVSIRITRELAASACAETICVCASGSGFLMDFSTMGSHTRPRAIQVDMSATPVGSNPTDDWNPISASRVAGPNTPSTAPL